MTGKPLHSGVHIIEADWLRRMGSADLRRTKFCGTMRFSIGRLAQSLLDDPASAGRQLRLI